MSRNSPLLDTVRAIIHAQLAEGPMTVRDLSAAAKCSREYVKTVLYRERMAGAISCIKAKGGHLIYYPGQTAPKAEAVKPAPKAKTQHSIPVKTVTIRPFSIAGEDGLSFKVTLPAAPWEAAA